MGGWVVFVHVCVCVCVCVCVWVCVCDLPSHGITDSRVGCRELM